MQLTGRQALDGTWTPNTNFVRQNIAFYAMPPISAGYNAFSFLWFDGQQETALAADDLTVTGPIRLHSLDNGSYYLDCDDFGSGAISYTKDGVTSSIPMTAVIPSVGFYSDQTASESAFVWEFEYGGTAQNTLYLVPNGNYKLTDAKNIGSGSVNIDIDSSGSFATVTILEPPTEWIELECDTEWESGGIQTSGASTRIRDVSQAQPDPDSQPDPDPTPVDPTPAADATTAETDAQGNVEAKISAGDAASGEVTLPAEVKAAETAEAAPEIRIDVPENAGAVEVEIPVENVAPSDVVVLVHADGTEEILPETAMTADGLKIEVDGDVTVKVVRQENEFEDVPEGWQKDAVDFVAARGLYDGVTETEFKPGNTMTRAMLATVLYRMRREPDAAGGNDFDDVAEGQWYSEAIDWAASEGIVEGKSEDNYGVNDPVTREQIVLMLWRMAGRPVAAAVETDAHDWAAEAMSWAIRVGLIEGNGVSYNARGKATRVETAAILQRFINLK